MEKEKSTYDIATEAQEEMDAFMVKVLLKPLDKQIKEALDKNRRELTKYADEVLDTLNEKLEPLEENYVDLLEKLDAINKKIDNQNKMLSKNEEMSKDLKTQQEQLLKLSNNSYWHNLITWVLLGIITILLIIIFFI